VQTFSLKELEYEGEVECPECKKEAEVIWMIQMLIKDQSTDNTDALYKVLLYSFNGKGARFFGGLKPCDLYKNKEVLEKLKRYVNILTKYNIYVDGILERRETNTAKQPIYLLTDTVLDSKYLTN
jgi:hypothetical protein